MKLLQVLVSSRKITTWLSKYFFRKITQGNANKTVNYIKKIKNTNIRDLQMITVSFFVRRLVLISQVVVGFH